MPTADQLINGFQEPVDFNKAITPTLVAGRAQSLWALAGRPGAGGFDATLNGVTLSGSSTQVAGQLPFVDPVSGQAYLGRLAALATIEGQLLLCDRIWHNGGFTITSTAAQNITSPTWPARDRNGATSGDGVLLGVEVSAATGAGTPTITISYTNQAGTAGRTATNIRATVATSAAGAFYEIGLQSGDVGVRSVQSLTLSATWTSGTINLVAYRVLARVTTGPRGGDIDILTGGRPKLYNGTVPFLLFVPNTTTASNIGGIFQYSNV